MYVGNELSCQVSYQGDANNELYPPSAIPGDCGTFLFDGTTLYTPDFANHTSTATSSLGVKTVFTAVSQTDVLGSGSSADPYKVITLADAGSTGIRLTETDSYVTGQEYYRADVKITNNSSSSKSVVIYRAGDCYLQESDTGYGFQDTSAKAVGCAKNANNSPAGRIEEWFSLSTGNSYLETNFGSVWTAIAAHTGFDSTCKCTELVDQGAGLSWSLTIPANRETTVSQLTVFSPTGIPISPTTPTSSPSTTSTTQPTTGSPSASSVIRLPSNRRCVSRRKFRIRLRQPGGLKIEQAIVFVNGTRVKVVKGSRITAPVNLTGLPKGKFTVKITVITSTGKIVTSTRKYKTCTSKQRGGSTPKL